VLLLFTDLYCTFVLALRSESVHHYKVKDDIDDVEWHKWHSTTMDTDGLTSIVSLDQFWAVNYITNWAVVSGCWNYVLKSGMAPIWDTVYVKVLLTKWFWDIVPQPKLDLVHFSIKIWLLVRAFFVNCLKSGKQHCALWAVHVRKQCDGFKAELDSSLLQLFIVWCWLCLQWCVLRLLQMAFQRAARTDKGVSAAGQVVSLKICHNIYLFFILFTLLHVDTAVVTFVFCIQSTCTS